MPHYLRALKYASEPEVEWGPAKNENRFGRYQPKIDKSERFDSSKLPMGDENFAFDLDSNLCTRL